jgi:hypothetical protein
LANPGQDVHAGDQAEAGRLASAASTSSMT